MELCELLVQTSVAYDALGVLGALVRAVLCCAVLCSRARTNVLTNEFALSHASVLSSFTQGKLQFIDVRLHLIR
jgi:hypothetical protein